MARILLAWELGANLGHIDRQLGIARALRARGHEPVFLLRDLSRAHTRVVAEGFRIAQAPVWLPRLNQMPALVTFSNVLAGAGWLDPAGLAALICAWRTAFALVQPDALVADHAPTALLAARGSGLPCWACGSAFEIPPTEGDDAHFAALVPGATPEACRRSDAHVLAAVNAALGLLGEPALPRLSAFFEGVNKALITLPELAHYAAYARAAAASGGHGAPAPRWAGPMYAADRGDAPVWPEGTAPARQATQPADAERRGKRLFVYLEPGHPEFEPMVLAARTAGVATLVHAQGLASDAQARLGGPTLRLVATPVRMAEAMAAADAVVCHGGQGTMAAALLAGKPLLVIPTQPEQALAAQRLVDQGLGLAVPLRSPAAAPAGARAAGSAPPYARLLGSLLDDPRWREAASRVAARHQGIDPASTGARIAGWIDDSLQPPARMPP